MLYVALLPVLALFVRARALQARGGRLGWKRLLGLAAAGEGGAGGAEQDEWTEALLPARGEGGGRGHEDGGELPKALGEEPAYPAVEAWLRHWYFRQVREAPAHSACRAAVHHAQQRSCNATTWA